MATRTPKSPMAKPQTAPPATASETAATSEQAPMKLKELIEAVVERTGQRKGEVRTAVQAALAVIGETLGEGQEMNLPGLGKLKVNRTKPTPRGKMMMVKLIQNQKLAAPKPAEATSPTTAAPKL